MAVTLTSSAAGIWPGDGRGDQADLFRAMVCRNKPAMKMQMASPSPRYEGNLILWDADLNVQDQGSGVGI